MKQIDFSKYPSDEFIPIKKENDLFWYKTESGLGVTNKENCEICQEVQQ